MEIYLKYLLIFLISSQFLFSSDENNSNFDSNFDSITLHSNIMFGLGIVNHDFTEMKNIRQKYINDFRVIPKITTDFPHQLFYFGQANLQLNSNHLGLSFGYYSTGSRATYEDYSGKISLDEIVVFNEYGFSYALTFYRINSDFEFQMYAGIGISNLTTTRKYEKKIYESLSNWNEKTINSVLLTEYGLSANYFLGNIFVELKAGVQQNPFYRTNLGIEGIRGIIGLGYRI